MTTPAHLDKSNLALSFFKAIKDRVRTPNTTPNGRAYDAGWIDFDDDHYDNSTHNYWARVEFLDESAGSFSASMVQIRCLQRLSASDGLGTEVREMADLFVRALRLYGGKIKIYDFSTPASPVEVPSKFLGIQTSGLIWGEPESGPSRGNPPEGASELVLTYRFKVLPSDYTGEKKRDYTQES